MTDQTLSWLRNLIFRRTGPSATETLRERIEAFRRLLEANNRVLERIGDAREKLGGEYLFDRQYLCSFDEVMADTMSELIEEFDVVTGGRHPELRKAFDRVREAVADSRSPRKVAFDGPLCLDLGQLGIEQAHSVGEKMARLAEVKNVVGVRVPEGFVLTTSAFAQVMASVENRALLEVLTRGEPTEQLAAPLRASILRTELPPALASALKRAVSSLPRGQRFAVRSSGLGEDGEASFAGVHETVLNVARDEIPRAYLRVVASLYGPRALAYRAARGESWESAAMAVGCVRMLRSKASGVLHTVDPADPSRSEMSVSATYGLGMAVVQGTVPVDRYRVSRDPPHAVVAAHPAAKSHMYQSVGSGGVELVAVPAEAVEVRCLGDEPLAKLASAALLIERHMKCPQEIEWALEEDGEVTILQARPLRILSESVARPQDLQRALADHRAVLRGQGAVACRGIAAGRVHVIRSDEDPSLAPRDRVLVARLASPTLGGALSTARALITDMGAAAGHLATLAREYRIPAIVDTGCATMALREGMEVTVDAEENIIYEGVIEELLRFSLLRSEVYDDTPEFRALRGMLDHMAPLTLRDPASPDFVPERCATYHDILRYAHETAVMELSDLDGLSLGSRASELRRLALGIPLDLVLVDIGGGVSSEATRRTIAPEALTCVPLERLLQGLLAPGVWATGPADMDLNGFMASATRSAALTLPGAVTVERNLAIVSRTYMNLSLRLGYHFNVIDCYLGDRAEESYVLFRFVGGVTEMTRRSRRARLLAEILRRCDFQVDRSGDLVLARLTGAPRLVVEQRLCMLGRLVGFARQLDIRLRDETTTQRLVEAFLAGKCETETNPGAEAAMSELTQVMVLDDEATVGDRLKEYFEKKGMAVETFVDSEAAIGRLATKQFDVVVTDLRMKGPTGLDVLVHVRKRNLPTQVIIITAFADFEAARGAEMVGVYEFVTKPFKMSDMYDLVKKAAGKARRQRG